MNRARAYLGYAVRLGLGLGLVALLLHYVDREALLATLRRLSPAEFGAAFLASLAATIFIPATVTRRTLQVGDMRISLAELIQINFAQRFYVLALPHAVSVGLRWLRYRAGGEAVGWQAAALILFERLVQLLAVVLCTFCFLLLAEETVPASLRFLIPLSGGLSLLTAGLVLAFLLPGLFQRIQPLAQRASTQLPNRIAKGFQRLFDAINAYRKLGSSNSFFVVAASLTAQMLLVCSAWILASSLELPVSFAAIAWMRSVVFLLTVLPITVGGIGIRELGFVTLLHLHGIDEATALAVPITMLAFQLLTGAVGGVLELLRILRRRDSQAR